MKLFFLLTLISLIDHPVFVPSVEINKQLGGNFTMGKLYLF